MLKCVSFRGRWEIDTRSFGGGGARPQMKRRPRGWRFPGWKLVRASLCAHLKFAAVGSASHADQAVDCGAPARDALRRVYDDVSQQARQRAPMRVGLAGLAGPGKQADICRRPAFSTWQVHSGLGPVRPPRRNLER